MEPPELYQRLWATILRGETFQAEIRNRRIDGDLIDEAKTITPIRDDHGRIVRFVATGGSVSLGADLVIETPRLGQASR